MTAGLVSQSSGRNNDLSREGEYLRCRYSVLSTLYSTPVTAGDADITCCCRVMMGGIPLIVEENIGVQPDGS